MTRSICLALASLLAAGRAPAAPPDRVPADLPVVKGVVYKTVGDQKLDLWLFPPTRKVFDQAPVVVYVHGGGWGNGDKTGVLRGHVLQVVRELTAAGVACVTIEYRLTKAGGPTAADSAADCKDAVRFLAANAARYGLDPTRLATFGSSAGGHLALVAALGAEADYPPAPGLSALPVRVRCVAAFYPLTSFVHPEVLKGSNFERPRRFVPILGGTLAERPELARRLSPVALVTGASPPIFLAHGDADAVLSVKHSTLLESVAKRAGVECECVVVEGGGHGFRGKNVAPTEAEVSRRAAAFLVKHLTR